MPVCVYREADNRMNNNINTMAALPKQQSEFRYRFTILNFVFILYLSCILIGKSRKKNYYKNNIIMSNSKVGVIVLASFYLNFRVFFTHLNLHFYYLYFHLEKCSHFSVD